MLAIKGMSVLLVRGAYEKAIRNRCKHPVRANIPAGGKLAVNAQEFIRIANRTKRSVDSLMREAVDRFSPDFCQQTFKRPWPPVSVVLSEKTRNQLNKTPEKVKLKTNRNLKDYLQVLNQLDPADALALLKGGWPEDQTIRKQLRHELQAAA